MDKQELKNKLASYLEHHQLKSSKRRDLVIDTFFTMSQSHISIDDLLAAVHKRDPGIGYTTVYRTLKLLVDANLVSEAHFNAGHSRYEWVSDEHHDHMICTACGTITEFENQTIEKLQHQIATSHGFKLTGHKLELYGLCSKCG